MFTQKHYIAIADLIHERRKEIKLVPPSGEDDAERMELRIEAVNEITLDLVKLFKADNPKFKEFTFIEACNRDLKE